MLIMTNERCPECDAIVYMMMHPKMKYEDEAIEVGIPSGGWLFIADGCYLDRNGVMCITRFDENTTTPSYYCIMCKWRVD